MIRVKSVGGVVPQTGVERSFFRSYPFNKLSWQPNSFNVENNINVTYYNVYRRVQGSGDFPETPRPITPTRTKTRQKRQRRRTTPHSSSSP